MAVWSGPPWACWGAHSSDLTQSLFPHDLMPARMSADKGAPYLTYPAILPVSKTFMEAISLSLCATSPYIQ